MTLATDLNQPSTEAALSVLAASGWSLKAIAREWDLSRAKLVRIADRAGIDFSNPNLERAPVNMSELERLYRGFIQQAVHHLLAQLRLQALYFTADRFKSLLGV